jgi:group I intron endonuclease
MTIGIYKLQFTNTEQVYIGQSVHIERRFKEHINDMIKGCSPPKLQEAYNTYGMPILSIILECSLKELNNAENEAIDIYSSVDNGFNTLDCAGNPNLKGYKSPNAKYQKEDYISIFHDIVDNILSIKDISDKHKVTQDVVSHISLGKTHLWLSEEFPEKYSRLLKIRGNRQKTYEGLAILKSPEGELYELDCSVREFARRHELPSPSHISNLINGKRKSYLKWTLYDIEK